MVMMMHHYELSLQSLLEMAANVSVTTAVKQKVRAKMEPRALFSQRVATSASAQ